MSKQEILKVTTYLEHFTIIAFWKYVKTYYTNGIDFGFKNLHQATEKWLPKIVPTFLVFLSNGNHKLNSWMWSFMLIVYAKFQPLTMYKTVSRAIESYLVGVTLSRVTTILAYCLNTYYSLTR